jgi:hypothetical protein
MISYAGLHHLIYSRASGQLAELLRPESALPADAAIGAPPGAFWRGSEHYHGDAVSAAPGAAATAAMMTTMDEMHRTMNSTKVTGDLDRDFVSLMVPHHQSAVDMARVYLESGRDPALLRLAEHIVRSQQAEITLMEGNWTAGPAQRSAHVGH